MFLGVPLIRPPASASPAKTAISTSIINAFNAKICIAISVRVVSAHAKAVPLHMEDSHQLAYSASQAIATTVMVITQYVRNAIRDTIWPTGSATLVNQIACLVSLILSALHAWLATSSRRMADARLFLPIVYRLTAQLLRLISDRANVALTAISCFQVTATPAQAASLTYNLSYSVGSMRQLPLPQLLRAAQKGVFPDTNTDNSHPRLTPVISYIYF